MQIAMLVTRLAFLVGAGSVLPGWAGQEARVDAIPIEVWCVGDDGLTLRLKEALLNTLGSSPDFILSSGKKRGSLIATIPENVEWKREGKRTRVLYTIEFTSAEDRHIGFSRGSCWEASLTVCAAGIVKEAKKAVRAIR